MVDGGVTHKWLIPCIGVDNSGYLYGCGKVCNLATKDRREMGRGGGGGGALGRTQCDAP